VQRRLDQGLSPSEMLAFFDVRLVRDASGGLAPLTSDLTQPDELPLGIDALHVLKLVLSKV
jgi:hypothetical protein